MVYEDILVFCGAFALWWIIEMFPYKAHHTGLSACPRLVTLSSNEMSLYSLASFVAETLTAEVSQICAEKMSLSDSCCNLAIAKYLRSNVRAVRKISLHQLTCRGEK